MPITTADRDDGRHMERDAVVKAYFAGLEERSGYDIDVDNTPPKLLLRSVELLHRQARIYHGEGDVQTAYIMYLRFCKLCLLELPKIKNVEPVKVQSLKALAAEALVDLERLKPVLTSAVQHQFALAVERQQTAERDVIRARIRTSRDRLEDVQKQAEGLISFDSGPRKVTMASSLLRAFARIAQPNTDRSIETCGVLAGRLANNTLHINTVIVPKQSGTGDTCHMTHEEELIVVQDDKSLLTMGWIHTHPTQSCFLSSIDVHTQFGFQALLAEAVAVVLAAPRFDPQWGAFRLVDMRTIGSCHKTGFHSHGCPDSQLYCDIRDEITWDDKSQAEVIDLREL